MTVLRVPPRPHRAHGYAVRAGRYLAWLAVGVAIVLAIVLAFEVLFAIARLT